MEKRCPHCGTGIRERWHVSYGLQRLEKGSMEAGVPLVGKVGVRRESIVMVYMCELTNLPFLVAVGRVRDE